jgi:hypothetical protein
MVNKSSIKIVSTILLFTFLGCKNDQNIKNDKSITHQAKDSYKYKQLKGKFYTNKDGKLFEKKTFAIAGKNEMFDAQVYFDSLVYINSADTLIQKLLSQVIDIKTYTEFGGKTMYSKDKNNVYYSNASTSGDFRLLVSEANPNTFKPLSDYLYGIDNKNIFYRGKKIKGLNFKKHQILYSPDTTDHFINYIKDDKVVFYNADTVKGADAKTFKLVAKQKWRAEDKNHKYECCGQPLK